MSKQTTTDFESKIRDICTYHSEFGEGTSGYNLSEEQFQKVFSAVSELVEECKPQYQCISCDNNPEEFPDDENCKFQAKQAVDKYEKNLLEALK